MYRQEIVKLILVAKYSILESRLLFPGTDKDSIFSLVVGKKLKTIGLTEVHLMKVELNNKATFLFL